jgi:hypothetical protein
MDYHEACECFDFSVTDEITVEAIKRQYRKLSLQYHPDKNPAPNASAQFQRIHEAYMTLMHDYEDGDDDDAESDEDETVNSHHEKIAQVKQWLDRLYPILQSLGMDKVCDNATVAHIVQFVSKLLEARTTQWINTLDKDTLLDVYCFICKHRRKFPAVTDRVMQQLGQWLRGSIDEKCQQDRHLSLAPSIGDVLECNLYCHTDDATGQVFTIPLWMEESVFDISGGGELCVRAIPQCPANMYIDDHHHLHVRVELTLDDVWNMRDDDDLLLPIGNVNTFTVKKGDLLMRRVQIVTLKRCGIPVGNPRDILDVSKKGDVVFHIYIH